MGMIQRAGFAGGLFFGSGFAGLFWLYIKDVAQPLISQHSGFLSSQWAFLEWAFPTACLLLMFAAGLYLVYGGVQEERRAERRPRRY